MIEDILSESGINWVINSNMSRRLIYHAGSIHNKRKIFLDDPINQDNIDGFQILTDISIRYLIEFCNPQNDSDYGLLDLANGVYEPFSLPTFPLVKNDYTRGEFIQLTPLLRKLSEGSTFLNPNSSPAFVTSVVFGQCNKIKSISFLEKYESELRTPQQFLTRAFQFYEFVWWSTQNGSKIAIRDDNKKSIQALNLVELDYI